jgi:hypothetical protein
MTSVGAMPLTIALRLQPSVQFWASLPGRSAAFGLASKCLDGAPGS